MTLLQSVAFFSKLINQRLPGVLPRSRFIEIKWVKPRMVYGDSVERVALAPLISSRVRTRRMGKAEAPRRPVLRLPPASSEM